jgi:hypothetical protein
VLILVGDVKSQPFIEPARRIDFHHAEGDCLTLARRFVDDRSHHTTADPLSLEAPLHIKRSDKDRILRRRGLQPADIVARDRNNAYICQLPLLPQSLRAAGPYPASMPR